MRVEGERRVFLFVSQSREKWHFEKFLKIAKMKILMATFTATLKTTLAKF